jgi:CHAT domain-containing protein
VSGLWDVYDETGAQLMHVFFKRLKAGDQVPTALANAQREFLSNRRKEGSFDPWMHPCFWAVYKATGSDLTRVGSGK